jgi:hypothetical protein
MAAIYGGERKEMRACMRFRWLLLIRLLSRPATGHWASSSSIPVIN